VSPDTIAAFALLGILMLIPAVALIYFLWDSLRGGGIPSGKDNTL
jgi:hypothetical protein